LSDWVNLHFPLGLPEDELIKIADKGQETPVAGSLFEGLSLAQYAVAQDLCQRIRDLYELKISFENPDALKTVERYTILNAIDRKWQEHLYHMDSLRNSIGLRAYGQRDPLIEYKMEAFKMFDELMVDVKGEICHTVFRSASSLGAFEQFYRNLAQRSVQHQTSLLPDQPAAESSGGKAASDMVTEATEELAKAKPVRTGPKVGRNDPCPCGSGKKYKQCCGR
jgi:preprotein translocase subunit SecA